MRKVMPYISIKSVLFELGTLLEDDHWDEGTMLEWATKGYRKFSISQKYDTKEVAVAVTEHTTTLPPNLKFLNQVVYRTEESALTELTSYLEWSMGLEQTSEAVLNYMSNPAGLVLKGVEANSELFDTWRPMKAATSDFHSMLGCVETSKSQAACDHTYSVNSSLVLTTTLKNGYLILSYQAYPCTDDGDALIPDNEDLKEALVHYCMYRYWLSKSNIKEEGARSERDYHLSRYQTLKAKASAALNMPDLAQLENIKNMTSRMMPQSTGFSKLFKGIGVPTQNTYH
jgi:hypothetical protein